MSAVREPNQRVALSTGFESEGAAYRGAEKLATKVNRTLSNHISEFYGNGWDLDDEDRAFSAGIDYAITVINESLEELLEGVDGTEKA